VIGESVGELEIGEGVENIADTEAPAAERASGHRAEGGEPAAMPETPRPAGADHEQVLCRVAWWRRAWQCRLIPMCAGLQQPEDAANARAQVPERGGMLNGLHRCARDVLPVLAPAHTSI
jgi:hypothetical protein